MKMDEILLRQKWVSRMDTLQSFRVRLFLRDGEGQVPLTQITHGCIHYFKNILSDVSMWDEEVFGGLPSMYGAFYSAAVLVNDTGFEIRLIGDCPLSLRSRLLNDICASRPPYTWNGISILRIVPWLEWGGSPPGGEPEPTEIRGDELDTIHEMWTGQGPFHVEHILEAEVHGNVRRYRARAEWKNNRLHWNDRQFTYIFADAASWVEAHADKIRDLLDPALTVLDSRVIRKPY